MAANSIIQVLMIDDDDELTASVRAYFQSEEGFTFASCNDGESGAKAAITEQFDVIILDVTMPKMNGFETLKMIRSHKDTPVIMLTARGDDFDRILGLEIGADDYVAKPCNLRELVARVRAIMRRVGIKENTTDAIDEALVYEDLRVTLGSQTVEKDGVIVPLTGAEFLILEKLITSVGEVVSKDDISRHALGRRLSPYDRSVDTHIVQLRKKLGPMPDGKQRIKTLRGRGYLYVTS